MRFRSTARIAISKRDIDLFYLSCACFNNKLVPVPVPLLIAVTPGKYGILIVRHPDQPTYLRP